MRPAEMRIKGRALRALALGVRSKPVRTALAKLLRTQLGIDELDALGPAAFGPMPMSLYPLRARTARRRVEPSLESPAPGSLPTAAALASAFRKRTISPAELLERVYRQARAVTGSVLYYADQELALRAAEESAGRWQRGEPRSLLDGVPIVVKEEIDVQGLPTRLGTSWIAEQPAERDSVAVERLRAAGAIIVGNSPMTEYGLSPLGVNVHRTMPRNVHDSGRLAGGSSTGPAVAVASGLVPVALGVDGGGSIRTPAALNGVFGLKPSYGRIPLLGHGLNCGSSVVHVGPIGASAEDLAIFTELAAGPLAGDSASAQDGSLGDGELLSAIRSPIDGLRIGVDEREWAAAEPGIASVCEAALRALTAHGAELVPIDLPLARHAAAMGYLTIGVEAFVALMLARTEHMSELGLDVQILLSSLDTLAPDDYLQAQRLRTSLRRQCAECLSKVDLIALPTTARVAPPVTDVEARGGFIDSSALDAMCRFAFLGNLTGLPAATAPVGEHQGLPVGLQLVGDAWDEALVLRAVAALERSGIARVKSGHASANVLG